MESVEAFLSGIDSGLLAYKDEFKRHAVTSENTLKYLRNYELEEMNIPAVFKRMLLEKIINLQTPETKSKLKEQARQRDSDFLRHSEPKRLKFGETEITEKDPETENERTVVSERAAPDNDFLKKELRRLNDDRDSTTLILIRKRDEMKELKKKPSMQPAVGIPGNPITKSSCENCHRIGHRAVRNKGNKSCPYLPCAGYDVCGMETKHPEYRQALSEITKDVNNLERQLKNINDELNSIKMFQQHNSSNFISVMRPVLKSYFPMKYFGKDGAQNLQRDLRYLKIPCDGKIPEDQSKDNINCLLGQGKSRVSDSVGTFKSSCDNKLADNDTSSELKDKCHDVVSIASITAKTSPNVTSDAMTPFVRSPVCQPIPYSVTSPLNMTGYMPVADPYYNMPYTWMYGNYHNSVVYQPMPNVPTSRASTPTSTVTSGSPAPLPPGSPPRNSPLPDKEQEF